MLIYDGNLDLLIILTCVYLFVLLMLIYDDVTFDEFAMFGKKKKLDYLARNKDQDHGVNHKMEFEVDTSNNENVNHVEQSSEVYDESQNITIRRSRKEIKKLSKYASCANTNTNFCLCLDNR
ncbi:hypothetical protein CR513_27622, partial [Mucuna pruriens]